MADGIRRGASPGRSSSAVRRGRTAGGREDVAAGGERPPRRRHGGVTAGSLRRRDVGLQPLQALTRVALAAEHFDQLVVVGVEHRGVDRLIDGLIER